MTIQTPHISRLLIHRFEIQCLLVGTDPIDLDGVEIKSTATGFAAGLMTEGKAFCHNFSIIGGIFLYFFASSVIPLRIAYPVTFL